MTGNQLRGMTRWLDPLSRLPDVAHTSEYQPRGIGAFQCSSAKATPVGIDILAKLNTIAICNRISWHSLLVCDFTMAPSIRGKVMLDVRHPGWLKGSSSCGLVRRGHVHCPRGFGGWRIWKSPWLGGRGAVTTETSGSVQGASIRCCSSATAIAGC